MISSINVTKSQETTDLVTFTEEILNGKLNFLCSDTYGQNIPSNKTQVLLFHYYKPHKNESCNIKKL